MTEKDNMKEKWSGDFQTPVRLVCDVGEKSERCSDGALALTICVFWTWIRKK